MTGPRYVFLTWKQHQQEAGGNVRLTHHLAAICESGTVEDNVLTVKNMLVGIHLMSPGTPNALNGMSGLVHNFADKSTIEGTGIFVARLYREEELFSKMGFDFQRDVLMTNPRFPAFFDARAMKLIGDWSRFILG